MFSLLSPIEVLALNDTQKKNLASLYEDKERNSNVESLKMTYPSLHGSVGVSVLPAYENTVSLSIGDKKEFIELIRQHNGELSIVVEDVVVANVKIFNLSNGNKFGSIQTNTKRRGLFILGDGEFETVSEVKGKRTMTFYTCFKEAFPEFCGIYPGIQTLVFLNTSWVWRLEDWDFEKRSSTHHL